MSGTRMLNIGVLGLALLTLAACAGARSTAAVPEVWFDSVRPDASSRWSAIAESFHDRYFAGHPPEFDGTDDAPRIVTIAWRTIDGRHVVYGSGRGWGQALARAREQVPDALTAFRLDLVTDTLPLTAERVSDPNLGWASTQPGRILVLPEARRIGVTSPSAYDQELSHAFRTRAYWLTAKGCWALDERGRREPELTVAGMDRAIAAAGGYLQDCVGADGRFDYLRRAYSGASGLGYSLLRHAGSLQALIQAYELSGDAETRAAIEQACEFLLATVEPWPHGPAGIAVPVELGLAKLGGSGLTLIALGEYTRVTGDSRHVPRMVEIARYIPRLQQTDGSYAPHQQLTLGPTPVEGRVEYYPGEADLGLLAMARLDRSQDWITPVRKNIRYLEDVRDPVEQLHDHWLAQVLEALPEAPGEPSHDDYAWRIARAIIDTQITDESAGPERGGWRGSTGLVPSTPASTRAEALAALHDLFERRGAVDRARQCRDALDLAIAFVLRHQVGAELMPFCEQPARSYGGVCATLEGDEIRIDFVQHALSAFIRYRAILMRERE